MSKKNNLAKRKKLHEFELKKEKEQQEKREKKLQAKQNKMKIDGGVNKKKTKKKGGFYVKKKLMTKLSKSAKAKVAQAMELDDQ